MDYTKLPIQKINKQDKIIIPQTYYENTEIIDIPAIDVTLTIFKDSSQDYYLDLTAKGSMVLHDAISWEEVNYPFTINLNEKISEENEILGKFIANLQNTLDIIGVLWENIVLEIPISYTTTKLTDEYHDGWELVGTKKRDIDPRMAPLMELLNKEKE